MWIFTNGATLCLQDFPGCACRLPLTRHVGCFLSMPWGNCLHGGAPREPTSKRGQAQHAPEWKMRQGGRGSDRHARRHAQKNRQDHEPCAVSRRHQERPNRQVPRLRPQSHRPGFLPRDCQAYSVYQVCDMKHFSPNGYKGFETTLDLVMLHSLRTYHLFRVLLATALLLSVSLPLVQYTCLMSGETMLMASLSEVDANHTSPGMAGCHKVPSRVVDVLCAHMGCCQPGTAHEIPMPGEVPCASDGPDASDACSDCFSETMQTEEAFVPDAKILVAGSLLPAVGILAVEAEDSPRSVFHFPNHGAERPPGQPRPLRVLFSSFLI